MLGIDPGTATTGWGIVRKSKIKNKKSKNNNSLELVAFGCILTKSTDEMGNRLLILSRSLKKIIRTHQPDVCVIERLFFGANSTSALSVGQARGVVLLVARENKLPVYEYTGLEVKLSVANHGRADKKVVQTAVRRHLGINRLPHPKDQLGRRAFTFRDDAYDAVAATICHVLKTSDVRRQI
ncbi:MAG: crossover junction endodeoxyribonuclease RuvC [Candidatus Woykebacteria bacterium RBG_16_44_10]|uniref:Crossover junction endodeoxyribonuclease RuvC n=1 Tax=Candidatus Woykebacteria bacterium RBG_16_44_10 TaxID=1802597 RepID=A0A1G1WG19_9BACT|nr:MAG: crossover junction endodeoxyribonuclease RuvC [Candidatus Woykebacteria bacterium RBG_16_44_10]